MVNYDLIVFSRRCPLLFVAAVGWAFCGAESNQNAGKETKESKARRSSTKTAKPTRQRKQTVLYPSQHAVASTLLSLIVFDRQFR